MTMLGKRKFCQTLLTTRIKLAVSRLQFARYKITLGSSLLQVCQPILLRKPEAQPQWLGLVYGLPKVSSSLSPFPPAAGEG
jgi:hypothetical protein